MTLTGVRKEAEDRLLTRAVRKRVRAFAWTFRTAIAEGADLPKPFSAPC
jgi:hypothetical protein